jgi:hypothetical protein
MKKLENKLLYLIIILFNYDFIFIITLIANYNVIHLL